MILTSLSPLRRLNDALAQALRPVPLGVVLGLGALAAGTAGMSPTPMAGASILYAAALGAAVAWVASVARRWSWLWMAGCAATVSASAPILLGAGLLALVIALAAQTAEVRPRRIGALVGVLSIGALTRAPEVLVTGGNALVTAVAIAPVVVSALRITPPSVRRRVRLVVGAVLGLWVVLAIGAAVAVMAVRADLEAAVDASESAIARVESADQEAAQRDLRAAESDLRAAADVLSSPLLVPAEAVPLVGDNLVAVRTLAGEGRDLLGETRATVDAVDYDGLRYQDGQISVAAVRRAAPPLARLDAAFTRTRAAVASLDSPWVAAPLARRIDDYEETLARRGQQARTGALAAQVAPGMLGADETRRWLVVFPTPAEIRGGGGFVGNYAVLEATDGQVDLVDSERITTMIDARQPGERELSGLPEYLRRYGRFTPADFPQDLLYSPHFPDDGAAFAQVAEQSGVGAVDLVLSVDPDGLAALLRLTGPVPVVGRAEPLRAEDARQWLLYDQYLAYGGDDNARSDALAELSREVFDRLTSGSLDEPRTLGSVFGPMVRERRMVVWSSRPAEQAVLEDLGVTGSLPETGRSDILHVSGINGGNNKIDVYLEREIEVEVAHDPATGEVRSTVSVALTNSAPSSGQPDYVIGNQRGQPPGTNLHLLSIYTPLSLEQARLDGEVVATESSREHGLAVYGRYIEIPPGATVTFEVDLVGVIPGMEAYSLVVPAQSLANPDVLTVGGSALGRTETETLDVTRRFTADRR